MKFYFNAFTRGQIIYANTATATAFQNFLQGIGTSLIGSGVFDRYFKVTDTSGFVQDDWKINDRLTVNLGLRTTSTAFRSKTRDIYLVNFLPDQIRIGTGADAGWTAKRLRTGGRRAVSWRSDRGKDSRPG